MLDKKELFDIKADIGHAIRDLTDAAMDIDDKNEILELVEAISELEKARDNLNDQISKLKEVSK